MSEREKVLITVKTYPTISEKYGELVCTAGIREDGSWVRIYPIPFRRFEQFKRFAKYTWIELPLTKNTDDPRPESFKPTRWDIETLEKVDTKDQWETRKRLVLKDSVYENMAVLIDKAKANELSLATFKPNEVFDFVWEEVEREWDPKKLESVLMDLRQGLLFEPEGFIKDFKVMPKLPYRFFYIFKDAKGQRSRMMLEDWEVGQLYWNCIRTSGSEQEALKKVKQKYFDEFVLKKDLYFFLGTTRRYHSWAKNPFVIIGTFHPPKVIQKSFDFTF
ncbi:MAG: hypothetical protein KAW12_05480 [Candidatus Aminicenantes bacterium]|nr:hypothetical protein [Candidatus Aminicenantes bacterium]